MSIKSEIERISNNVSDALAATAEMGATVPEGANSDNLGTLIRSIPTGGGGGLPPLRLFAAGHYAPGSTGSDLIPIKILTINESTNAAYTAEEISELANTRYVVLTTTFATMTGNKDGVFRYYKDAYLDNNSVFDGVLFTGHYVELDGKWIPATAKVGVDGVVTITDAEWKSTGSGGAITPGIENAGKLLYVDESGNVAYLQLGTGLEIVDGRLCIIGTVTPDEPDEPDEPDTPVEPDDPAEAITFTQTGEHSVTVRGVVFEQQEDGTVLWRGATFTPGEENSVVIK